MLPFWRLEYWGGSYFLKTLFTPVFDDVPKEAIVAYSEGSPLLRNFAWRTEENQGNLSVQVLDFPTQIRSRHL